MVVADQSIDSAQETVNLISKEGGLARAHQLDATQDNSFLGLDESMRDEFQKIDILHDNMGIGLNDGSPLKVTEEAWDRIFSVNIKSALFACKAVIAVMIKQGFGVITNISSVASIAGGVECVYLSFGY